MSAEMVVLYWKQYMEMQILFTVQRKLRLKSLKRTMQTVMRADMETE